jgi:hypothetical protein
MGVSDVEQAERHSRTRSLIMAVAAVPLLINGLFGFRDEASNMTPALRHGSWGLLILFWLLILATGGWLRLDKRVRRLMNDEVALQNRSRAIQTGFWVAMAAAVVLYFASLQWEMSLREGMRLLADVAMAASLLRYAWLELH